MVPDGQKVWTDGRTEWTDRRTDDAKTISLRLRRGIIMVHNEILITLTLHYKLVSTRDDGSYYISVWQSLMSLHVRKTSPGLSLFAYTKYES